MSLTDSFKSVAIVLLSFFIAFIFAELLLRALGIGYGNAPIEASKILHHVHPKNYKFRVHDPSGEYGGFDVVYDEFRYRISGEPSKKKSNLTQTEIYFLGDSFTAGAQVSWDESFVGKVGDSKSALVRNMGVSSYSPLFYLVQLRTELADLRNADVVLQLFDNDFSTDLDMLSKANSRDIPAINSIDGGDASLAIKVLRYSYVARLVRKVQLQTAFLLNPASQTMDFRNEIDPTSYRENSFAARQFTYNLLSQIKEICDSRSIKLHLMIIPSKTLSRSNECCANDLLHEEVKMFAKQNGISFIDLATEFEKVENQKNLFFSKDIHLTVTGHDMVSSAIKVHFSLNQ